jgi:hypothetical protein
MIEIPFEQQAMRNEPPPKSLIGINLLSYLSACYMYEQYHANKMSRDDGSKMKRQIVEALQFVTAKEHKYSEMWLRIESTSTNYAKNPTAENADMFYAAVYNLPDDWRLKR